MQPWTVESPVIRVTRINEFKFYPNPAKNEIILNFENNTAWIGKTISIININGTILSRIFISSQIQKINIVRFEGRYVFHPGREWKEMIRQKFIKL